MFLCDAIIGFAFGEGIKNIIVEGIPVEILQIKLIFLSTYL